MLVLQLVACGLLLHEALYLASRGPSHWRENAAPVLGLHLDGGWCIAIHLANVISAVVLLAAPSLPWMFGLNFFTLSLLIAIFPRRLPNHLIVAWFILAAFVGGAASAYLPGPSQPIEFSLGLVQALIVILYAVAGFHKLNKDFFTPHRSCGAGFVVHYLLQRGLTIRRWPWYAAPVGIYFVVVAELMLPFLLLSDPWRLTGLALALLLHVAFGFLAHLHFSAVMFAGLAAFLPQQSITDLLLPHGMQLLPVLVGIPLGLLLGNHKPYRHAAVARCNHAFFGMVCVAMAIHVSRSSGQVPGSDLIAPALQQHPAIFCLLALLFLLNGVAPYFGFKQDFSLAMFSNLRMDDWRHFVVVRPLANLSPRYVMVDSYASGVSDPALATQFETYFPDRDRQMFAIGYVLDIVQKVALEHPDPVPFSVQVRHLGSETMCSYNAARPPRLRLREKISVFPYTLPCDASVPVLS